MILAETEPLSFRLKDDCYTADPLPPHFTKDSLYHITLLMLACTTELMFALNYWVSFCSSCSVWLRNSWNEGINVWYFYLIC